jgi:intracellular sulfur oxidation DsrE/DsrF family protein
MKQNLRLARYHLALGILLALAGTASAAEPEWQYPLIRGYGKVLPLPDSALQPDPNREARIVVNVTRPMTSPEEVNPGLDRVARLVNLFALSKVPPGKMKIVAVMHGGATAASLDNFHYREKYQRDNPNVKLIEALKRAGVMVYVCGQALAHNGFAESWVNPDVTVALSAMMVLAHYQSEGYALVE